MGYSGGAGTLRRSTFMTNRDWRQIEAELRVAIPRTSSEPAAESAIRPSRAPDISISDTEAVLDQIAKALRPSKD